jgi:hypothetical protein
LHPEILDEALARAERREERWVLPELLCKKGELLLLGGAATAAAEAADHFAQALDWARRQEVPAWELRDELGAPLHQQGRTGPARELLAPVYGRFTEGFALMLLEKLAALIPAGADQSGSYHGVLAPHGGWRARVVASRVVAYGTPPAVASPCSGLRQTKCATSARARTEHQISADAGQDRTGQLARLLIDDDVPGGPGHLDLFTMKDQPAAAVADRDDLHGAARGVAADAAIGDVDVHYGGE